MSPQIDAAARRTSHPSTVPSSFTRAIALHLFRNLHPRPDTGSPLILGIHGPSGEGKTYQCFAVLKALDVEVIAVSGGLLESPDAGRPAEVIREAYEEASRHRAKTGAPAVVLINDIDTAVGDWGPLVQTTVNRQIVLEELMNLADVPNRVYGRALHRSPIVLTGNDFTRLYAPLLRFGRMSLFTWKPGPAEKAPVVGGIFPELSGSDCERLVHTFQDEPIAFFAQLRHVLREESIWRYMQERGITRTLQALLGGTAPALRDNLTLEALVTAGQMLRHRHQLANHLGA